MYWHGRKIGRVVRESRDRGCNRSNRSADIKLMHRMVISDERDQVTAAVVIDVADLALLVVAARHRDGRIVTRHIDFEPEICARKSSDGRGFPRRPVIAIRNACCLATSRVAAPIQKICSRFCIVAFEHEGVCRSSDYRQWGSKHKSHRVSGGAKTAHIELVRYV